MSIIKQRLSVTELLAGLAEECGELTQAALKLRRVFDKKNPTPTTEQDAVEHLYEEIADVWLYLNMIDLPWKYIKEIGVRKQKRWEERLNANISSKK